MNNRYLLLIPALFIASVLITSCEDSSDSDSPFGNISTAGITGVNTVAVEEFCCWEAGSQIHFSSYYANYHTWTLDIAESAGYFRQLNSDPLHWRGKIQYYEKNKYCQEMIYVDSLFFDIATSESGWNEGTFRTGTAQYEKGNSPGPFTMNTYYIMPKAGNFNTLDISDANHNYIFSFQTRTDGDINSWKIKQMPQGWMNSNGRFSMLILPILYGLYQ